jgi:hypothetical protein
MHRDIFRFAGYCMNEIMISNPRLGVDTGFIFEGDIFSAAQGILHFSHN